MSAARDSWVETIAGLLGDGPLHPTELARWANRLRAFGQESPALIASLLGPDPRFRLDPEGRWQLTPGLAGVRSSLGFLDYAVVDVETTGGAYQDGHRIIELAIVELREGVVTREFQSLINPQRDIAASVTRLTGISATRVAAAPRFRDIAGEIRSRLEHRVFAAHNVDHDWAFVGGQLREAEGDHRVGAHLRGGPSAGGDDPGAGGGGRGDAPTLPGFAVGPRARGVAARAHARFERRCVRTGLPGLRPRTRSTIIVALQTCKCQTGSVDLHHYGTVHRNQGRQLRRGLSGGLHL